MRASSKRTFTLFSVLAALVALAAALAFALSEQRRAATDAIARQGPALTALLADRLVATDRADAAARLHSLEPMLAGGALAYVSVEQGGTALASRAAPGLSIPAAADDAAVREFDVAGQRLREFSAGGADGTPRVRSAWRVPPLALSALPAGQFAAIVAPFAIAGLCGAMLLRRGTRPLGRMADVLAAAETGLDLPAGGAGAGADIVDAFEHVLKAAEQRLRELSDRAQDDFAHNRLIAYQKRCAEAALDALPDGLVIMDEGGVASFASQRVESLIGIPGEAIVGHKPHEWCEQPDVIALLSRYSSNVTRLRRNDHLEFCPGDDDGRRIRVSARPLSGGRAGSATVVVFRDVTHEALARKSRDDFVGHVAHELKSPLNVIRMHAEMLADFGEELSGDTVTSINVIEDEVDRLAKLIEDVLNLTRLESGSLVIDRQRVKLNGFLEDVFETVRRAASARGITTSLDVPARLGSVALDKDLFRIALNNLLTNAVKYNRDGGNVSLHAEETDESLIIRVADTGLGIAPEARAHIFDKFYRADDETAAARGGHGLGLALAREIVTLHNGRLTVESTVGEGSTFTIELRKSAHLLQEAS